MLKDNPQESRRSWLNLIFKSHGENNPNNKSYQVWQQKNHPIALLHPKFTMQKIDYIHNNPVLARIVGHPANYIYSSARNYYGRDGCLIEVELPDYGAQEGYVFT